jgi:uridine kinase
MVTIYCKNTGTYKEYPMGISLLDIYNDLGIKLPYQVVAARVNYKVESLNFRIYKPKNIEFIDVSCPSGYRVYLRSISMIMAKALSELCPTSHLRIEHPICQGYYCCIDNRETKVAESLIDQLRDKMCDIIAADMPIVSEERQTTTAIEMFRQRGLMDKAILFETLGVPYVRYFRIDDYIDHYNGVLVPSTGYVPMFDLQSYKNGILLRVIDKRNPSKIADFIDEPKMFDIFNEFVRWNKLMELTNVGDFNKICRDHSVYDLIKVSEALH